MRLRTVLCLLAVMILSAPASQAAVSQIFIYPGNIALVGGADRAHDAVVIRPLGMNLTNVGGGVGQNAPWAWRWVYNPESDRNEYKWVQLHGVSGILVRTWGRVDSVDASAKTFVISDGNRQYLKCSLPSTAQPPILGQFVAVAGLSATEMGAQDQWEPLLRIRSQSDISVYTQ